MFDIHGNTIKQGDRVYVLTSPHAGSKYKRLFFGKVTDTHPDKATCKVKCYENGRIVSVTEKSIVKPWESD